MSAAASLDALRRRLSSAGLDRLRVLDGADWDRVAVPEARCAGMVGEGARVLVVGNAGGALWSAFLADLRADPRRLAEDDQPLDAYVRRAVEAADVELRAYERRWVFGDAGETDIAGRAGTPLRTEARRAHLDMRTLAERAGIGVRGRLELLMDAEAGPWIGLRAACFVQAPFPADAAPTGFSPCADCDACARACPGGAFTGGRFDIGACVAFRAASTACAHGCAARRACPVGTARAYPKEAERYHSDRAGGRALLEALVARGS